VLLEESYKSSGVDIEAGELTVQKIKGYAKSTFNKQVLTDIGLFGGFYELDLKNFKKPVLVSSVDGVGTKLKIAFEAKRHDTIGQDLVNHCVNDIAVCGARPLFFLDYYATGKLSPDTAAEVIKGFSIACKENGCALIGGETAEMPGFYQDGEYDLSGTIVGIVDKNNIIDGSRIKKGDLLLGFPSNGLHTNGFSLARKVLLSKYNLSQYIDQLGTTLEDELLRIHKSYLNIILKLTENDLVNGFSHITGGGIIGNTMRIIPDGLEIFIHWGNWELPPIFKLIQETGNISSEEMRKVFNLGIGLIAIIPKEKEAQAFHIIHDNKEHVLLIGEVV
jgi:phosphoribosylformylglycinamidine cyclo-ligase